VTRKVLGKGLKALIPDKTVEETAGINMIPVDLISPNPQQPRKKVSPDLLNDLVESIRSQGLLQPVLVKKSASGYELIAGERRWRAGQMAGLEEIPALIKEAGRQDSLAMALVENIQRENLNPMEAAAAYQSLISEFSLTQEEVAGMVGKERASIANYLRLLKLPMSVQEDLAEERLSMGHARALLGLPGKREQVEARDIVLAKGLSVRETEELVKKLSRKKSRAERTRPTPDLHLAAIQEDLIRSLGTKVKVEGKSRSGSIRIFYHSPDELERLLEVLLGR
jgi:ParB family chromosome partitioning protein